MFLKELDEYTNQELIDFLNSNKSIEMQRLGAISSEILRRMNETKKILTEKQTTEDWGNPIIP